jgi:hypothetical protein
MNARDGSRVEHELALGQDSWPKPGCHRRCVLRHEARRGVRARSQSPRAVRRKHLSRMQQVITMLGMVVGRSLASRLGRRDGVARVADFRCADACAVLTGRVWAVTGSREM